MESTWRPFFETSIATQTSPLGTMDTISGSAKLVMAQGQIACFIYKSNPKLAWRLCTLVEGGNSGISPAFPHQSHQDPLDRLEAMVWHWLV